MAKKNEIIQTIAGIFQTEYKNPSIWKELVFIIKK